MPFEGELAETPARGMRISVKGLRVGLPFGFKIVLPLGRSVVLTLGGVVVFLFIFGLLLPGTAGATAGALLFLLAPTLGIVLGIVLTGVRYDLAEVTSPREVLARDRQVALLLFGLVFMLALGAGLIIGHSVGPWIVLVWLLMAGVGCGFGGGLALSMRETEWPSYTLARGWLAYHHHLPWSLMDFLDDAHRRGVLRQAGAVYQFRHIELQRRLANGAASFDATGGYTFYRISIIDE